jgi:hypothetical protein
MIATLNSKQFESSMVNNTNRVSLRHGKYYFIWLHSLRSHSPQEALQTLSPIIIPQLLPCQLRSSLSMQSLQICINKACVMFPSILNRQSFREEIRQVKNRRSILQILPIDEPGSSVIRIERIADVVIPMNQRVILSICIRMFP